jgi:acetylornithine deacetylase
MRKSDGEYVNAGINAYVDKILRPEMQAISPSADVVTHVVGEVDGLEPMDESEAVKVVSELTGANGADVVSFGTEAGLFQSMGISTVVCGPGSIEQAHKPDEYLSTDELSKALRMLDRLQVKLEAR